MDRLRLYIMKNYQTILIGFLTFALLVVSLSFLSYVEDIRNPGHIFGSYNTYYRTKEQVGSNKYTSYYQVSFGNNHKFYLHGDDYDLEGTYEMKNATTYIVRYLENDLEHSLMVHLDKDGVTMRIPALNDLARFTKYSHMAFGPDVNTYYVNSASVKWEN